MRTLAHRPVEDTGNGTSTIEELLIAKLGGKREYGLFRDKLMSKTKRPRRRTK